MLTVLDIVNWNLMDEAKIHTAIQTLQKRSVESVSVIEIPVENFIRKNEFVLSTGIGCGHDPELLEGFVKDVLVSEPAALALATGRHITRIPENVLRLAEEHDFPIIDIPWHLRFADITQTILQELNARRQKESEQSEKIQQQLLNLILHGGDLSTIAAFIHDQTKKPAVILDGSGTIQGMSHGADALAENWQHHQEPGKTHRITQMPIRSASSIQGTILFPAEEDGKLPNQEKILLEHAATAAALWFLRDNAVRETELRLQGDFVWNLAQGEFQSWDSAHLQAQSFQFDLNRPYVCLLAKAENENNRPSLELRMRNAAKHILNLEHVMHCSIMVTFRNDTLVVFLETSDNPVMETVNTFFQVLDQRYPHGPGDLILSWGIGENHAGIRKFHESYKSAKTALDIGAKQKGPGHRVTYGDIPMYRALAILCENKEIIEITHDVIGKLIRYREAKDIDLLETARQYIRHKGNISKTARALHLHRQSLIYRLQKIESLTLRSFDNPDDFFLLDLCIKLWETGISVEP